MVHEVTVTLTAEDEQYARLFLAVARTTAVTPNSPDDLSVIQAVQRAVLALVPGEDGIPFDHARELRDLYIARTGLCYDRSRAIEMILRYLGFHARHVFLFSRAPNRSWLASFVTVRVPSHAVTEVLTREGWLVVDSNAAWISLDRSGHPVSIRQIHAHGSGVPIQWRAEPPAKIYTEPFAYIIGLYSRHGRFYPPYDGIPDVNYSELRQNLAWADSSGSK
jgi:hypothetical protein